MDHDEAIFYKHLFWTKNRRFQHQPGSKYVQPLPQKASPHVAAPQLSRNAPAMNGSSSSRKALQMVLQILRISSEANWVENDGQKKHKLDIWFFVGFISSWSCLQWCCWPCHPSHPGPALPLFLFPINVRSPSSEPPLVVTIKHAANMCKQEESIDSGCDGEKIDTSFA